MDAPQFDVIVDGEILPGFDSVVVLAQLQQQLKLPEAKARQLLSAKPTVVKRAVSSEIADAYCRRLQTLGLATRINQSAAASPSPASTTTTTIADRFDPDTVFTSTMPLAGTANSAGFRRALYGAMLHATAVATGYVSATIAAIFLLLAYTVHFSYLLTAPPIVFSVIIFAIPLLGLSLLAILLLRPLLPLTSVDASDTLLSRDSQPHLFSFIERLCNALSLRMPAQITLSVDAANTISLLPGAKNFWRGDYRLTLSLPLIDNGSIKTFGAILGSDLAIDATRTMLRYQWLRSYRRAHIDACLSGHDWLQQKANQLLNRCDNTRFAFLHKPIRHLIQQSNNSLQPIIRRFDEIDRRLTRAQQFEQDRYCALIAGTAIVGALLLQENKMQRAVADAAALNREQLHADGACDDLPALIQHYFASFDDNFARQIKKQWEAAITSRKNEPAVERERIEQASIERSTGIIASDKPAIALLQQRESLAQTITAQHYRELGWDTNLDKLQATDALTYAATQDILLRQQAETYFNNWFKPFRFWSLADYALIRDMPLQDAAQQLNVCINEIRRLTPDRAKLFAEQQRLQNQIQEILLGQHVLAAGKKFAFRTVAYDGTTLQPLLDEKQQLLNKVLEQLSVQEAVMGGRMTLGFRLCGQNERDVELLHDALRLLRDCGPRLDKIALDAYQLEQLLDRHYRQREADYSATIIRLEQRIEDTLMLILTRLSSIPNPRDAEYRPLKYRLDEEFDKLGNVHQKFATLQRARRTLDTLYALNEQLSLIAADYGTIAEEAYRIESIKLINPDI